MIISKKIENDQLYLYMNGQLIYKRWLKTGASKVFDVTAYDKYTLTSFHEMKYEGSENLILIKANLTLKASADGGRETGIVSGYRPNHVFEYESGRFLQTYIGDIIFDGSPTIQPGETKEVTVRMLLSQPIEKYLTTGCIWWIHEGARAIGRIEMLAIH